MRRYLDENEEKDVAKAITEIPVQALKPTISDKNLTLPMVFAGVATMLGGAIIGGTISTGNTPVPNPVAMIDVRHPTGRRRDEPEGTGNPPDGQGGAGGNMPQGGQDGVGGKAENGEKTDVVSTCTFEEPDEAGYQKIHGLAGCVVTPAFAFNSVIEFEGATIEGNGENPNVILYKGGKIRLNLIKKEPSGAETEIILEASDPLIITLEGIDKKKPGRAFFNIIEESDGRHLEFAPYEGTTVVIYKGAENREKMVGKKYPYEPDPKNPAQPLGHEISIHDFMNNGCLYAGHPNGKKQDHNSMGVFLVLGGSLLLFRRISEVSRKSRSK